MPEPARGQQRFFTLAAIEPGEGGFVLTLDGRPARTPGRSVLALPTRALGDAIAAEWNAQGPSIRPATMHLTRLANTAIDGVAASIDAVREDIVRYAGSDLVVYRAGEPDSLVAAQSAAWDPVLAWARETLGARFVLREGMMFVQQPEGSLRRVRDHVDVERSPFVLAALHTLTTLSGSALLALAHADGWLDVDAAWAAACVDEVFQESRWGADEGALARRTARRAEFEAAARVLRLSRS